MQLIDCDVHVEVPSPEALLPYLPPYWVEYVRNGLFKGPVDTAYPKTMPTSARPGSTPANGVAGSSLELLRAQVLDGSRVAYAIANCSYAVDSLKNPEAATAFASAANDWLIAEWLDKEPRLRAAVVVPSHYPELAAREVERVGAHPGFVQVFLPVRSQHPYGSRLFRPMWDAIARQGLVAGLHFGGAPGNPPTPSGWPSYYFEEWAGMAQVFQSQLVSIVAEGVFDLWPSLRLVLLEAGFNWLPPFMWRFDKEWKNLQRQTPWVKRPPSAYVREHVRLTVQPLDMPPERRHLAEVLDQMGSDELLLFASDYPHNHASSPEEALLPLLPEGLARNVANQNARALYAL